MINPRKYLDSAVVIYNFPMGQISNITTLCRHQTVIKEREIKVDNFFQKAINPLSGGLRARYRAVSQVGAVIFQGEGGMRVNERKGSVYLSIYKLSEYAIKHEVF